MHLDLLWSDPDPRHHTGCRKNEYRGSGYYFGKDVTEKFLQKRRYAAIIRSHQVKEKGYELQHGGKLITIFSASNYQGHSNFGAVLQWKHNDTQPCIKSYKAQSIDMNKLSFNKRVTLLEDQAYQSIIEKIFANKTSLQSEFAKADPTQTGISSLILNSGHISPIVWAHIMTKVLQIELPWLTLRSRLNIPGIMEDLYSLKDMLTALFNLIDQNHSGFINRNELAEIIKLLFNDDYPGRVTDAFIDEICSAMDINKDGAIDINEFFESFRLVRVKPS
ncbi:unnamed protein product [Rotaria sordida]|uniref:EF-hand domain-containing protein n=1 Tax=Rotaria sordida TaxID=392033 RepID=A0A818KPA0_9BILA|nr:unnamed protein product [Rotaria sordida]